MHSGQAGEVQNNRVRTFRILEVLQGKMQTHALSKTVKLYLHTVFRQKWYRAKIQVGFYQLYFVPLHSVCSKRLRVVQSAHEEDEGAQKKRNPDMSIKEQYIRESGPQSAWCPRMHLYTFLQLKEFIHIYTEE